MGAKAAAEPVRRAMTAANCIVMDRSKIRKRKTMRELRRWEVTGVPNESECVAMS